MDKMAEPRSDLLAIEDAPETVEMEEHRSSDLAESPSMMADADHEGNGSEDDPVTKMQKALHLREEGKGKQDAEKREKKQGNNLGAKAKSSCLKKRPAASKAIQAKPKATSVMKVTPKANAKKAGYTHRLMSEMDLQF